jgi:hypothetical protein
LNAEYVVRIANSLRHNDPLFSKALIARKQLMVEVIWKVHQYTHESIEDLFQDLLVDLVATAKLYPVPLYRYKKKIWELEQVCGSLACLKSARGLRVERDQIWVPRYAVERVRKASLSSLFFTRIRQFLSDKMALYFSKRRGFEQKKMKKCVTSHLGGLRTGTKDIVVPKQTIRLVNISDFLPGSDTITYQDTIPSPFPLQDAFLAASDKMCRLSDSAHKVALHVIKDGKSGYRHLQDVTNFSKVKLSLAKMELTRMFMEKPVSPTLYPVYFTADHAHA